MPARLRRRRPARGAPAFDRQIPGFALADAVMTGVETRTSSPIRIKRGDDFQSVNTGGLYPAGEGASYAGGILRRGWTASRWRRRLPLALARDGLKAGSGLPRPGRRGRVKPAAASGLPWDSPRAASSLERPFPVLAGGGGPFLGAGGPARVASSGGLVASGRPGRQ